MGDKPDQCLGLTDGAGITVEQEAVLAHVGLGQALRDHPEHHVVGQQLAGIHVLLGLSTEVGARQHGLAQHLARGDVRCVVVLRQRVRLRALAGALPAEHDEAHHYFRNPS